MPSEVDTDVLVEQAAAGDRQAADQLLHRHRQRLRKMVSVRLDPALKTRVDASDVVQDTLAIAHRRLGEYLGNRSVPFYAWLRNLAWQRLIDLQRLHIKSQRRSVAREDPLPNMLSDESVVLLANQFATGDPLPSQQFLRDELQRRLKLAMEQLGADEREILVLRHLEDLSVNEVAAILDLPQGIVQSRHFRAVQKLRRMLDDE